MKNIRISIFFAMIISSQITYTSCEKDKNCDNVKNKQAKSTTLTSEQQAELEKALDSDRNTKISSIVTILRGKIITNALIKASSALREINNQLQQAANNPVNNLLQQAANNQVANTVTPTIAFNVNPLDSVKSIGLSAAVPIADDLEYNGRKYYSDLCDDEIENKMIGERAFLLSIAGYLALSNPASAAVMVSSSLLYSIYKLQNRINFREKYKQDPVTTINDHKNQNSKLKFVKDFTTDQIIYDTPNIMTSTPSLTSSVYNTIFGIKAA